MRVIIWTIIGIWILWKIIDAFRSYSSSKNASYNRQHQEERYQNSSHTTSQDTSQKSQQKKGELKPDAGEYVDYEEIK